MSRRTSKTSQSAAIDRWASDIKSFRESVGFDLSDPVGFSEYLLAVYGKGSSDKIARLFDFRYAGRDYGFDMFGRGMYQKVFDAWVDAMAPEGMICARGLYGLGFLPGDDIPSMIYKRRGTHGDEGDSRRKKSKVGYYSMNVPIAVNWFALRNNSVGGEGGATVTPMLARAASAVDHRAAEAAGIAMWKQDSEVRGWIERQAAKRGEVAPPSWVSLPSAVKKSIIASECPVVIIVDGKVSDMHGWGGDSESGDTMEAEIHMKHCEPKCVLRFFVASALYKLGKPVRADERRYYGLDEHMVVTGRKYDYYEPKLILHPDASVKGRLVRNLPDDWKWYEIGA